MDQCKIRFFAGSVRKRRLRVDFHKPDNVVDLGEDDHLVGHIQFLFGGNTFISGGKPNTPAPVKLECRMASIGGRVVWGEGSTSNGAQIVTAGNETEILIGRDCMFAQDIWVRNSDMHGIFDLESGDLLNPSANVMISDHVWVGQESIVLKGSTIGGGSIIGARSLVSGAQPARALILGAPAKVHREGVSWSRSLEPSAAEVQRVKSLLTPT